MARLGAVSLVPRWREEYVIPAASDPDRGVTSVSNEENLRTIIGGDGELARLMRAHDWARTPLGPLEQWPQSLRTAVSLILNSQHPMWIGWGPEMTFLYNDAYIDVLSLAKHPWALGRPAKEVWAEIWDVCGPLADKVFQKAEASYQNDVRLFMNRGDILEEVYYSFSYSPIMDESGRVGGLFCPSAETSAKVLNTRRLRTLSELAANALVEKTTESACASAAATIAKNADDVPFFLLYILSADQREMQLESRSVTNDVAREFAFSYSLHSPDPNKQSAAGVAEVVRHGEAAVISVEYMEGLPKGPANQRVKEAIILPVQSRAEERAMGVLIAAINPTRRLDDEYETFYDLVSRHVATAISNARAYEEERRRAEALAELDRAKTAFFSNVSHEFRTPLTLMLGPLEEVLGKPSHAAIAADRELVEVAHRNGTRLLKLVNTLLDFSRIEAGRVRVSFRPTDLGEFTGELASLFRSATDRAGLRLTIETPELPQPVFVDREMWEKIVLNLLSNAFKFTFDGSITLRLEDRGDFVQLTVQDTGVGIPDAELPRVFERFHRVEGTRGRSFEGSGIGLALVQELVKLHGGTIAVDSEMGRGTSFHVTLPYGSRHLPRNHVFAGEPQGDHGELAGPYVAEALSWLKHSEEDDQIAREVMDDLPLPIAAPASHERVLLVDDNQDMREYVERLLSHYCQVSTAENGRVALQQALENPPDLVLTDVMMPEMNGFELLAALRSHAMTCTIPIILLSARAGDEARVEGLQQGADDYLTKPFSARELLARVRTHLELARVRKNAADEVRRRAAQFEVLLNQAPLGIYLVDADFRMRQMNPFARMAFGELADEIVGWDFGDVVQRIWEKDYAEEITRIFRRTLETGESYEVPEREAYRIDRKARETYSWRTDRVPLPEGGYGVVCYFRDIANEVSARNAIREHEAQLRKMERIAAAGKLAASLAHEINNPLSSVTNALYLLEMNDSLNAEMRNYVLTASGELKRVSRIVQQSLSYHRAGVRPHQFNVADVVNDSLHIFRDRFRRNGITLVPKLSSKATLYGVPDEVRQVVDNLLLNSAEAMPQGGEVVVSVRPARDRHRRKGVRVTVADSGPGIPAELRGKIFEPFFTTKAEEGTGLGLWVLQGIVAKYRGSIRMRSRSANGGAPGGQKCGTVFSIFLASQPLAENVAPHPLSAAS